MVLLAWYDDGKTVVMLLELIGVFLHLCDGCFLNYCILGIFGDGIGGGRLRKRSWSCCVCEVAGS